MNTDIHHGLNRHQLDDDNDIYNLANEIVVGDESNILLSSHPPTSNNNNKRKPTGNLMEGLVSSNDKNNKKQKLPICDTFGKIIN